MAEPQGTTDEPRHYLSALFSWRGSLLSSQQMGSNERLVAMVLSTHMNERGGSCFPSIALIVRESRLGERTVYRSIKGLEDAGWLKVEHGKGGKLSNRYTASFPEHIELPRVTPATQAGSPATQAGSPVTSAVRERQEDDSRSQPAAPCQKCEDTGWIYEGTEVGPCSCRGYAL